MKKRLLLLILCCVFGIIQAQNSGQNYIHTRTMLDNTGTAYLDNIVYYDGLGRPFQTIQKGVTSARSNLITLQEYNSAGQETNTWLPVVSTSDYVAPASFKSGAPGNYNNDSRPYSRQTYELSSLSRPIAQYGPGVAWSSHPNEVSYLANSESSPLNCKYYTVNSSGGLNHIGLYANNQLYVTKNTDEDGNVTYSFTDKRGLTLLIRQMNENIPYDTYYVYDDMGNRCYVLPPMYQEEANLDKYAFQYKYDGFNRCVEKKMPGAEAMKCEYDGADRIIFSQDGKQRASDKWTYYLYDNIGRVIQQGECTGKNTSSGSIHLINYYDNYDFLSESGFTDRNAFPMATVNAQGLPTGSVVAVLENGNRLYSASYYDSKGRVVQTISSNHLGGYEKETIEYNFTGQPLSRRHIHSAANKPTQAEDYTYVYDHASRLTTTKYELNNSGSEIILAQNTYDEFGRLSTSTPHNRNDLKTTYTYNIRSWINQISSTPFRETLTYTFNGNIKTQEWVQAGKTRKYTFAYDNLNRIKSAVYIGDGNYSTNYSYDRHGNIRNIVRYGNTGTNTYGKIDDLTLMYNGNQLIKVEDAGVTPTLSSSADFRNRANVATEYFYDANGNMTKDFNKGISDITYNLLNLPSSLTISNELGSATNTYLYTAGGNKLNVTKGGFTTDYIGNVIYENGSLKRLLFEGGYYENGVYYFYIRDHLGNNRIVVNQNSGVVQSTQYYPFGVAFADGTNPSAQPFKYGNKELDSDRGLNLYDSSARYMDMALGGRTTTMDPLLEMYYSWSPYAYCANNPMRFVDPTGMAIGDPLIQPFQRRSYQGNIFSKTYSFAYNTGASICNVPINIVNQLVDEAKYIGSNGIGAYVESGANAVVGAVTSEVNYITDTSLSKKAADLGAAFTNAETWENVAAGVATAAIPGAMGTKAATGAQGSKAISGAPQGSKAVQGTNNSFTVTPQGVALPKDIKIPAKYIENPKRPGSYGVMENNKFVEKLRIDPATKPGTKGPNNSHFHIDSGRKHETDLNKWPK